MTIDVQVLTVALLASGLLGFNIALAWVAWRDSKRPWPPFSPFDQLND